MRRQRLAGQLEGKAEVSCPAVGVEASSVTPACLTNSPSDMLSLFVRLLPAEFFAQLWEKEKIRENNRVYTQAVVIWLMIVRQLLGNGTMETAVLELAHSLPEDFWLHPCKRLQPGPENQKPKSDTTRKRVA